MSISQRSHSAAPTDSYHSGGIYYRSTSPRRGSLSPPEDRYIDYTGLSPYGTCSTVPAYCGVVGSSATAQQQRFQSRSATATPTGSPKKRQLPQVFRLLLIIVYLLWHAYQILFYAIIGTPKFTCNVPRSFRARAG